MVIRPGDVLFVWGHGVIPDLIEGLTGGPSHVAIFKNENTVIEAQGGRLIGEQDLSFYYDSRLEVWTDPTLTDDQRQQMVEFAATLYGTPYDYFLIGLELLHEELGLPIGWYHENHHLICSTFAYTVADHVGRKWANVPNPSPVDLMRGGVLQKKGALGKMGDQAS